MKRVLTITLGLFLAAIPLIAQRVARPMGGSRMVAGPRIGGSRIGGSRVAASRIVIGPRGGFSTHVGVRGPGSVGRFGGNRFVVRPGFHRRFYPGVYGYPYSYFGYFGPYAYSSEFYGGANYGGADPYYVNGGYSYDDAAAEQQADAQYQQLNGQLSALTAEVSDLRDENEALRSEAQTQKKTTASHPKEQKEVTPPAPAAQKTTEQDPVTVIVYKDGHRREVRSFAIVGKSLWILSEQRAQRVPLAELDLDATDKANAERGIDFPMPATK